MEDLNEDINIEKCEFCENKKKINSTIGDLDLQLSVWEDNKGIMDIRISKGGIAMTRPMFINYCWLCGKKLY